MFQQNEEQRMMTQTPFSLRRDMLHVHFALPWIQLVHNILVLDVSLKQQVAQQYMYWIVLHTLSVLSLCALELSRTDSAHNFLSVTMMTTQLKSCLGQPNWNYWMWMAAPWATMGPTTCSRESEVNRFLTIWPNFATRENQNSICSRFVDFLKNQLQS